MNKTAASLLISCLCVPVSAQWLNYPTAGIPRTKDGRPNLTAPAPRTKDGKPDLSGIWDIEHNRPCPPDGCPDMPIGQQFMDMGWGVKGGLPYQPWAAALVKQRMAKDGGEDPASRCMPSGFMKEHTTPLFRKMLQLPGLLVILSERDTTYRQIFLDGRPLPVDPQPSWNGYSVGKWDGDTLVVESNGLREGIWMDRAGSPLTEEAKITERFRRKDFGHLEIEVTVNDPKAYTAPWTIKINQLLIPDTELMDYFCMENEKSGPHIQQ